MLSDYLFTPKDLYAILKGAGARNLAGTLLLTVCAAALLAYGLPLELVLLLAFGFAVFYWQLNSRIPLSLALLYLIFIPVLLAVAGTSNLAQIWAEKASVWAFSLLALGVAKQVWEYIQDHRNRLWRDLLPAWASYPTITSLLTGNPRPTPRSRGVAPPLVPKPKSKAAVTQSPKTVSELATIDGITHPNRKRRRHRQAGNARRRRAALA